MPSVITKLDDERIDQICMMLRQGSYPEAAAAFAGVGRQAFYRWLLRGRKELDRRHDVDVQREKEEERDLTRRAPGEKVEVNREIRDEDSEMIAQREQIYVDLVNRIEQSIAAAEIADLAIITGAAEGTLVIERFTKKLKGGQEVEVVKYLPPDWKAAAFKLERRYKRRWGRQQSVELSGPDGKPVQVQATTWADAVKEAYHQAKKIQPGEGAKQLPPAGRNNEVLEGEIVSPSSEDL